MLANLVCDTAMAIFLMLELMALAGLVVTCYVGYKVIKKVIEWLES